MLTAGKLVLHPQYSQSDHATNSFKNASKTLNGLAIQLQCLYPPQYMVDVFEAQCDLQ